MNTYLEHANITFQNIDQGITFFQTAFPEFKVRGGGGEGINRWVHIGTDSTYVALGQGKESENPGKNYDRPGINHLGFVVDDVNLIAKRLLSAGYERSYPKQEQRFRVRDYFLDAEGNEYEFVQYLSDVNAERNDYAE